MPCNGCLSRGVVERQDDERSVFINEGYNKLGSTDWMSKYEDEALSRCQSEYRRWRHASAMMAAGKSLYDTFEFIVLIGMRLIQMS